jgi:cytochrome c
MNGVNAMKNLSKALCLLSLCLSSMHSLAECDVEAGKKQFNKCAACHSVEPGVQLMGPSLHGLMGREVGSLDDFPFSEAMVTADFIWTEETLDAFIENPMQYLPGTVMPFGGIRKANQRDALVCYIKLLD